MRRIYFEAWNMTPNNAVVDYLTEMKEVIQTKVFKIRR